MFCSTFGFGGTKKNMYGNQLTNISKNNDDWTSGILKCTDPGRFRFGCISSIAFPLWNVYRLPSQPFIVFWFFAGIFLWMP